ncbi:MAG: hypothetical protein GY904_19920 [Planctomycetaceae bacterium]|nr:hypothetical protein [Planctomycetaceae bacterium]
MENAIKVAENWYIVRYIMKVALDNCQMIRIVKPFYRELDGQSSRTCGKTRHGIDAVSSHGR